MPRLSELAARHTELSGEDISTLRRLRADWNLLADLAFSDLVLWVPTWNRTGYVAVAQVRPTTAATSFPDDLVGSFLPRGRQPLLDAAAHHATVVESTGDGPGQPERVLPVPGRTGAVALVAQHTDASVDRERSRLERTYDEVARRLFVMVAEGTFPVPADRSDPAEAPRVGDGLVVLDPSGVVTYASPNALSAYRRLGLAADLVGASLADTSRFLSPRRGPVEMDPSAVLGGRAAGTAEIEAKGSAVALRALPLRDGGRRTGAVVLVRDVSDLRRRDRELVTKDATIREIHHRVKNNLQTVAALLRLQARRLDAPDAVAALGEAERRVGSIAVVHEMLSTTPDAHVPFDEIADRLLAMVTEVTAREPEHAVRTARVGSFGDLTAEQATALALVVTELVQNAVEHGLAGRAGDVAVRPVRAGTLLMVAVEDDGVGLPSGFDDRTSARLGLQIARTLVADLGGTVELGPGAEGGTRAVVTLPVA